MVTKILLVTCVLSVLVFLAVVGGAFLFTTTQTHHETTDTCDEIKRTINRVGKRVLVCQVEIQEEDDNITIIKTRQQEL